MTRPQTALIVVANDFTNDSRLLRHSGALAGAGCRVLVLALHRDGLPQRESIAPRIDVIRVRLRSRLLRSRIWLPVKYLEYLLATTIAGLRARPAVINANDLATLPTGWLVGVLTRRPLVYDSHEYWRAVLSDRWPPWFAWLAGHVEAVLARAASRVMTVSDSIADAMATEMGVHPTCIRNVLDRPSIRPQGGALRRKLQLAPDEPIILYQGIVTPERGLETLVRAAALLRERAIVVILGNGPDLQRLRTIASQQGAGRVHFVPAVPRNELLDHTADATVAVHPIWRTTLNHEYCLPNKLFEYLAAGVPVIVTNMLEMSRFVQQCDVGITVEPGDAAALADAADRMLRDSALRARMAENARAAAQENSWEVERHRFMDVYSGLVHIGGARQREEIGVNA